MIKNILGFVLLALFCSSAWADVRATVVDVGPGLCVLISDEKSNEHILYDAGHWSNNYCYDFVADNVSTGELKVVIISHSDADHLSNLPKILSRFKAELIIHTGYKRKKDSWIKANHSISVSAKEDGASVINLSTLPLSSLQPDIVVGDMKLTLLFGLGHWDQSNGKLHGSHIRNALSIVVRLEAYGKSILLSGDSVGRRDTSDESFCGYSEKLLVDSGLLLQSDVLIAPHHGANNASSTCFINAVMPKFVVFSAGHRYEHPRETVVRRIKSITSIPDENIFRTDRGDDEGGKEASIQRISGCKDPSGDDDIEILLPEHGDPFLQYTASKDSCE